MNLGPGEQVIFEGHPSWRAILGFYIKGILMVAVIVALRPAASIGDETALAVGILIAGSAIVVLVGFLRRVATDYTITNRRLYIKHGIISRDVQETKIERVQDVNYTPVALPADHADRRRRLRHRRQRTPTGDSSSPASPSPSRSSTGSTTRPSRARRRSLGDESASPASATSAPTFGRAERPSGGRRADAGRLAQRVDAVGPLPGEVLVLAAEVAVGGGLLVDRPVQVEVAAERAGPEVEDLA